MVDWKHKGRRLRPYPLKDIEHLVSLGRVVLVLNDRFPPLENETNRVTLRVTLMFVGLGQAGKGILFLFTRTRGFVRR
jgi:hypothetical protein